MDRQTVDRISIRGFKSIHDEAKIELRPLTILAGQNSSGKSSAIQPLLLMKQTLEATYDPGPLLLNGPNAPYTSSDQFLARISGRSAMSEFSVQFEGSDLNGQAWSHRLTYSKPEAGHRYPLAIRLNYRGAGFDAEITIHEGMSPDAVRRLLQASRWWDDVDMFRRLLEISPSKPQWAVVRDRCFIRAGIRSDYGVASLPPEVIRDDTVQALLRGLIHLPGLRGNPERTYRRAGFETHFPGLFEDYVATAIFVWQSTKSPKLAELAKALQRLGLTWKVRAKQLNEAQLELLVGRLPKAKRGGGDLVNIADVGVGVSQVLPVVVALLVAEKGQAVYIEQPEIHLHPQAQYDLARLFADAANRGVRVIVETHSDLFLLGVQTLVAEGKLDPHLVMLHWFTRDDEGVTDVKSTGLDEKGTFGGKFDLDFRKVLMDAQKRYLGAQW